MATLKDDLIEQLLKDVDFSKLNPEQITGEIGSIITVQQIAICWIVIKTFSFGYSYNKYTNICVAHNIRL